MWTVLFYLLVGFVAFWFWAFIGSRMHCPRCGNDIRAWTLHPWRSPPRRRSCSCGWREDDDPIDV